MTTSRQIRRNRECAAIKAERKAIREMSKAPLNRVTFDASPLFSVSNYELEPIRTSIRPVNHPTLNTKGENRLAKEWLPSALLEDDFRKRVCRHSDVPIYEVSTENRNGQRDLLIAPVCPGEDPGTIRVRVFVKRRETIGMDAGRFTVSLIPKKDFDPGTIDEVWAKLSAHQRMSMMAAVADRTPKGGPRKEAQ
ncbi:hypothetical protein BXY70_1354 [Roseovarius halotolerans]|uniref:Uncharacterized protein n=1 Tax=Roseovarius halotolerans TaxID=505353 RepID=A0A1X6Y533_9RHOB|nr:hypothetical protein [Roseovarius halotolerans]RKT35321.1 hypothetical protein BXY70_1354 [Roseovarius halotolerans]SLN10955.1 hypothetical protein ROH8110_00042 [Roseovarius halotolerans]